MIEKLFRRMLIKRFMAEQANNHEPTKNSHVVEQIFYRTLGLWFGIGILLSYIAYEYGLDSRQCNLCNQLVDTFPSIDVAAAKSDYPNVMRIIWLYLTVTTPLSFLGFISSIPYVDYRKETRGFLWAVCCAILFSAMIFACVGWFFDGGPDLVGRLTRLDRLFIHTILGSFILCFSYFFMISLSLYILVSLPIIFIKR